MQFELTKALLILERTPATLSAMLQDLPEDWTHQNEGGETWSPYDVVGHLIHGEQTDWVVRTKVILHADDKNFEPFDRFAQFENSKGKDLNTLLNEFEELRKENLNEIKSLNIQNDQLTLEGIHPEFKEVSLKSLLAAWVVHDLGHINQISRVMAKLYKEETGPWPKYLKVLNY